MQGIRNEHFVMFYHVYFLKYVYNIVCVLVCTFTSWLWVVSFLRPGPFSFSLPKKRDYMKYIFNSEWKFYNSLKNKVIIMSIQFCHWVIVKISIIFFSGNNFFLTNLQLSLRNSCSFFFLFDLLVTVYLFNGVFKTCFSQKFFNLCLMT